jgi:hypothetical protein
MRLTRLRLRLPPHSRPRPDTPVPRRSQAALEFTSTFSAMTLAPTIPAIGVLPGFCVQLIRMHCGILDANNIRCTLQHRTRAPAVYRARRRTRCASHRVLRTLPPYIPSMTM